MRNYNASCKEAENQLNLLSKFVQEDKTSSGSYYHKQLLDNSLKTT